MLGNKLARPASQSKIESERFTFVCSYRRKNLKFVDHFSWLSCRKPPKNATFSMISFLFLTNDISVGIGGCRGLSVVTESPYIFHTKQISFVDFVLTNQIVV